MGGVFLFMLCISFFSPFDPEGRELLEHPCPAPPVMLSEYKTVVKSLDLCNERLHDLVISAYENDYEIQQNEVVERFQPDTPEAEDIAICKECSANCEEALQWCYFYRGESCFCLDEEEEW